MCIRDRSTGLAIGGSLLLLLILLNLPQLRRPSSPSPVTAPASGQPREIPTKSIAVLPFDDFDMANGASYFADGVQDDILTDLAKAEDLKVISRSGTSAYRK